MNIALAASQAEKVERTPSARAEVEPQPALAVALSPSIDRSSLLGRETGTATPPAFPALSHTSQLSGLDRLSPTQLQEIRIMVAEVQRTSPHGAELARELIRDLTRPEEVNQGINATCTMTTLQKQLASENPLEYARMVRDLAVTGKFEFKDPQNSTVSLDPRSLQSDSWSVPPPYEQRSKTETMVQNVLMRYAIGDTDQARADGQVPLSYNHATDTITGIYQGQNIEYRGLFEDQVMRAMQGVTGRKGEVIHSVDQALPTIERELSAGRSVMVELKWASSGLHQLHALSVDHIDHRTGTVYLFNPHGAKSPPPEKGAIQAISLAEFENKFECAFVLTNRPNDGRVPPPPPIDQIQIAHDQSQEGADGSKPGVIMLQVTPPVSTNNAEASSPRENSTAATEKSSPAFVVVNRLPERESEPLQERPAEASVRPTQPAAKVANSTLFTDDDELRRSAAERRQQDTERLERPK